VAFTRKEMDSLLSLAEKGIAQLVQLQKQSRQTHIHAGA
jgi:ribonuclease PH